MLCSTAMHIFYKKKVSVTKIEFEKVNVCVDVKMLSLVSSVFIHSIRRLSHHEQLCLIRLRFGEILLPSTPDDGRIISRNLVSVKVLARDIFALN